MQLQATKRIKSEIEAVKRTARSIKPQCRHCNIHIKIEIKARRSITAPKSCKIESSIYQSIDREVKSGKNTAAEAAIGGNEAWSEICTILSAHPVTSPTIDRETE